MFDGFYSEGFYVLNAIIGGELGLSPNCFEENAVDEVGICELWEFYRGD